MYLEAIFLVFFPLQNNLKYATISAAQKNCHICVPGFLEG